MAYQPKSYRKFLAGTVTAAVVASAMAPAAGAQEAAAETFSDVPASSSHYDAIYTAVELGLVNGYSDNTFKPLKKLTRSDVVKTLARYIKQTEEDLDTSDVEPFADVTADYKDGELYEASLLVKKFGVFQGSNNNLNPSHEITRQAMAKVLVNAFGLTDEGIETNLTDLDAADAEFREYIDILAQWEVTNVDTFRPKSTVDRGQYASFLVRAYEAIVGIEIVPAMEITSEDSTHLLVKLTGQYEDLTAKDFVFEGLDVLGAEIIEAPSAAEEEVYTYVRLETSEQAPGMTYKLTEFRGIEVNEDGPVVVTPATPEVTGVSAINAKQLEVKFSVAVDKTTAENEDLYFIQRTGDASPVKLSTVDATAVAELQEDGKTVVITTTNDIETSFSISGAATPFKFSVDGVKTAAKEAIEAKTFTISVSDSVAPTFVSASASAKTTTNNVTLKFSEPVVATSGVVKVNGVAASVAPGSNPTELTVTTGANLASGSTYEVELLNFKDFAGNFLTPNPVKTSVTVASNVTAPTISDVKVVRDNLVEVTFDKAMKTSSLSNVSVRLLDGNYTNIASTNIVSVTPKANTSNRVFQITLDNTPALPFNNGVFTGTLVFTDSIEDSVGNTLNTTNRVVSISEDTTAPSVASASFKKADTTGATYGGVALTNGAVVVKFNEGVSKAVSTVGTLKLIDNNGNDVTSTYLTNAEMAAAQVNPNDNTELVIPLNTAVTTAANISSFTLRLPSGVAADLSLAANSSNSSVNTFNVEAGTNTSGDTVKPVIVSATPAANNEIQVAVTEANLDNSSAINLNNYRLDGAPLPTGTYVTVTGTAPNYVIHLHLPAGSISESRDYALNVSGIKDTAGNVASMFVDNTVALVDDVMPELKTASLNTNGSLTLGYSEALAGVVAATDLKVTLNGKVVDSAQLNLVAGTGGETGKDVLTVDQLVDQGVDLAYGGGDDTLYIDVDGIAGYAAGTDILISTGSFTAGQDGAVYDLRNATTLKVGTVASPVTVDGDGNELKGNTTITVK